MKKLLFVISVLVFVSCQKDMNVQPMNDDGNFIQLKETTIPDSLPVPQDGNGGGEDEFPIPD